jgi:hypothetical protein
MLIGRVMDARGHGQDQPGMKLGAVTICGEA